MMTYIPGTKLFRGDFDRSENEVAQKIKSKESIKYKLFQHELGSSVSDGYNAQINIFHFMAEHTDIGKDRQQELIQKYKINTNFFTGGAHTDDSQEARIYQEIAKKLYGGSLEEGELIDLANILNVARGY